MKLITITLLLTLVSCSSMKAIPVKITNHQVNSISIETSRIECVQEFIYREVKPLDASRICSDIYKRR